MLEILKTAGSALTAQRLRMDVISSNLANAEATSTPEGGPYKRERVVFEPMLRDSLDKRQRAPGDRRHGRPHRRRRSQGRRPGQRRPAHGLRPDAPRRERTTGSSPIPNVDLVTEMTDMLSASRSYEANITIVNVAKSMAHEGTRNRPLAGC